MSDPEPDSRADTQFGPCHLRRLLGRDGVDEVYDGEDAAKAPIAG
jgi:serine/threonine-protein kinase